MDLLQLREKGIFETLKAIKHYSFVVIGGYAVNAYALPRFSIDCDIVIDEYLQLTDIEKKLAELDYKKTKAMISTQFHGDFKRYEKAISSGINISIDVLYKQILDRQTNAKFDARWVFENSLLIPLKGKTITESLKLRIINLDALIVMKLISCRGTDMRDVFMMAPKISNATWIRQEISKKYNFEERFNKIKNHINSKDFRNNLQGVYGYINEKTFEKHKEALLLLPTIT